MSFKEDPPPGVSKEPPFQNLSRLAQRPFLEALVLTGTNPWCLPRSCSCKHCPTKVTNLITSSHPGQSTTTLQTSKIGEKSPHNSQSVKEWKKKSYLAPIDNQQLSILQIREEGRLPTKMDCHRGQSCSPQGQLRSQHHQDTCVKILHAVPTSQGDKDASMGQRCSQDHGKHHSWFICSHWWPR